MNHLMTLCRELKLDASELKEVEKGSFLLPLSDQLSIEVKSFSPMVFLRAIIAPCPKDRREDLFILIMKANFLGQGTFEAAIGLSPEETDFTLSHFFPEGGDYQTFHRTIEDFANTVEYWRREIK